MKSAYEICRSVGITLKNYHNRQHYLTCPRCSSGRKPHNRKKKCFSVSIDERGVRWFCHNCEWAGMRFYDEGNWAGARGPTGRVIERPVGRIIERSMKSAAGRVIERPGGRAINRPLRRTIIRGRA